MKNKIFKTKLFLQYFGRHVIYGLFVSNTLMLSAQYPYVKTDSIVSYYQLRDDHSNLTEGYYFEGLFEEPVLSDGLIVTDPNWGKNFANPVTCSLDSSALLLKLYCRNIDSIKVSINKQLEKTIVVNENGYQYPCISNLNTWQHLPSSKDIQIKDISIAIFSQTLSPLCVMGDIQVLKLETVNRRVLNPFFDDLFGTNAFDGIQENSFSSKNWPDLYIPFSYYLYQRLGYVKSEIYISTLDSTDRHRILYDITYQALKKYPYYKQYHVDTVVLFNRLMMLKNDPYKPLTDSLIPLINGIGDPHFFLKRKSNLNNPTKGQKMENQKYNPLRFITLNRKIYIVSVLSKDIEDIQIGDQLLSFENKEVQTTTLLGNEDINKELNRILKDSMPVSFLRGKDTINTNFRLVSRIESIYKIPHRKYTLDEGIFYYKLNSWENIEYMYFHNAITENNDQQVKCIIFDLRNNGGGWETSAEKIASCFITRPHVYTHHSYTYNNNQMIKESWVIQPNANLRLTNIPVILLVNKNTVCASEAFCYFLKQNHPDTYIISNDEHTPGAYNSPSLISLFDDLLLRLVYQTFYVSDGSIIEKKGITPDIYVHYKNVFDLAAYNDKLLQTAKELANYLKK